MINLLSSSVTISILPKNGLLAGNSVDSKPEPLVENKWNSDRATHRTRRFAGRLALKALTEIYDSNPHVPFTLRIKADGFDGWLGPNGDKEMPSCRPAISSRWKRN